MLRFLAQFLQIGSIWEVIDSIRSGNLTWALFWINFLEGIFKGVPQGLLQSYIALTTSGFDWIFSISVSSSFLSLSWALVSFEGDQVEKFRQKKIQVTSVYFVTLLLYRLMEVPSRLLMISLFASFFKYWIFSVLGIDYLCLILAYFITTKQVKSKFKVFALFVYIPVWIFVFWDW